MTNSKRRRKSERLAKLRHRLETAKGMLSITVPSSMADDAWELIKEVLPGAMVEVRTHSVVSKTGNIEDRVKYTVVP